MKVKRTSLLSIAMVCGLLSGNSAGFAQKTTKPGQEPKVIVEDELIFAGDPTVQIAVAPLPHPPQGPGGDTFVFVSSEMNIDGKVVKGAPYSADAITETTQTLSDGNRIVRKNSATIYRDGEGRTRREQTLATVGTYPLAGDLPQTFFINDPVAGVNYILDPRTRTARKLKRPPISSLRCRVIFRGM